MVSVDRWLAHWPGVAGVSAVSWWAARIGAAGLLSALGFSALGLPSADWLAAGAVAVLAIVSVLPGSRHLVHAALGFVALAGLLVTGSGLVALQQGRLITPLLPAGPLLPGASSGGDVIANAATTVVLLCLAAVCLPAVSPATSGGAAKRTRYLIWGAVGTAVTCWAFAVPILLRVGGMSLPTVALEGRAGALSSSLAAVLGPLGGGHAAGLANWVLCATCLAGALGALAGGTGLAEAAASAARTTRSGRPGPSLPPLALPPLALPTLALPPLGPLGIPGPAQLQSPSRALPRGALAGIAVASALAAGAVARVGQRGWLVVALGGLATGALALTTLAPPVLRQCQRVPTAVRACVAAIWAIVVTVAIGSAWAPWS